MKVGEKVGLLVPWLAGMKAVKLDKRLVERKVI